MRNRQNNIINHQIVFIMSTKTSANASAKSEETRVYPNITANITAVTMPKNIGGRVTISLDCEPFTSMDIETGQEVEKTSFGINQRNLINQIAPKVKILKILNARAMGRVINPEIISLVLTDATIEVKRTFHAKGTQRRFTDELYSNDCIVSDIVDIKTHIDKDFMEEIQELKRTQPFVEVKPNIVGIGNPFGI